LTGGPQISRGPAGHPCGAAHLEPDPGAASASPLPDHGGGLTPAGQWVAVRHGFLLPARVVMAVFRGKMVAAIQQTFARGALTLPAPMRPQQLLNLLNRLGHPRKTKWNVRIMERYRHGAGVVTYLARSLRGGPIKNARLVAYDGDRVTFTYRA